MSGQINIHQILEVAKKKLHALAGHGAFLFVIGILLSYVFVVWRISQLANTEPTQAQEQAVLAESDIPKLNKKAIEQIQTLENNSAAVHSLFEQARNNPFKE